MSKHILCLLLFSGTLYFTNLGGLRLMDRDEPRNAGCAAEMLARNDWVTPTFNSPMPHNGDRKLRTHKPAMAYWLMMTSYTVFGVNEFGARFFSALMGVGTILMTYGIGRRLFNPAAAFWGAIATASAFFFTVASRISTPDAPLIFFSTLSMFLYVIFTFKKKEFKDDQEMSPPRLAGDYPFPALNTKGLLQSAAIFAAMALAVLSKGPLGLVIPTAVIGMFLLIATLPDRLRSKPKPDPSTRQLLIGMVMDRVRYFAPLHFLKTCGRMHLFIAILMVLLIAAPWYIMVHLSTDGEWTHSFFILHNLKRSTMSMEGHGGPDLMYPLYLFFYYPVLTLLAFFPFSCFLFPAITEWTRRIARKRKGPSDPWRAGLIFAGCWVFVWLGVFSIAKTKLPSYITPMYPGLGLIVGVYLFHWRQNAQKVKSILKDLPFLMLALTGLIAAVALPIAALLFAPGDEWIGVAGLITFIPGIWMWQKSRISNTNSHATLLRARKRLLTGFTLVGAAIPLLAFSAFLPYIDSKHQRAHELFEVATKHSANKQKKADMVTFRVLEPSWVFYLGRPIFEGHGGVKKEVFQYLKENKDAFLVTQENVIKDIQSRLPEDFEILHQVPYFMQYEPDLVLLGRDCSKRFSVSTATE